MKGHLAFDNKMFNMNLVLINFVVLPLAFAYSKLDSSYFSLKNIRWRFYRTLLKTCQCYELTRQCSPLPFILASPLTYAVHP